MKIIQIVVEKTIIYGLGDDGKLYLKEWIFEDKKTKEQTKAIEIGKTEEYNSILTNWKEI